MKAPAQFVTVARSTMRPNSQKSKKKNQKSKIKNRNCGLALHALHSTLACSVALARRFDTVCLDWTPNHELRKHHETYQKVRLRGEREKESARVRECIGQES